MALLQDIVHKFEVGSGSRVVRIGVAVLALVVLVGGYNLRAFKNMATQEAMDAAQLARHQSEGEGYKTLFIRPFSLYLVKKRNQDAQGTKAADAAQDPMQIKQMHPDLANPPVYPMLLAGLMKVLPFSYAVPSKSASFWNRDGMFWWYPADFTIGLVNQVLFIGLVVVTFLLARELFDASMAWVSGGLLLGSELLWRFSVSGLSTMLLLLIFMGLAWCLVLLEREAREPKRGPAGIIGLAALAGAVVGIGGLTRYAFGWLIFPVLLYVMLFSGGRRATLAGVALGTFLVVMTPWVVRNYMVSGTPFGTAGFSILEGTLIFPADRLPRSLEPDLSRIAPMALWIKLIINCRQILQSDLPKLGGSWVTAFFLVGLLVGYRNPSVTRLRYFLLSCLPVLILVQALGRTQLSEESPEINSENLLVLLAPLVLVYGVSLFFMLLDHMQLPFPEIRLIVIGLFGLAACLPLIFTFLPPRTMAIAYPPYNPPAIESMASWLKEKEMTMSDVPWAVAWYGNRQSVWLTLKCKPDANDQGVREDFYVINDYQKPINLLYLTPRTMDARLLSQWVRGGELSWGGFIFEILGKNNVPADFPLHKMVNGLLPEQVMLSDWERWRK